MSAAMTVGTCSLPSTTQSPFPIVDYAVRSLLFTPSSANNQDNPTISIADMVERGFLASLLTTLDDGLGFWTNSHGMTVCIIILMAEKYLTIPYSLWHALTSSIET